MNLEATLLAGMAHQRGRLLEVIAAMKDGDMTDDHARSYLALVQDNLAAIRKAAGRRDPAAPAAVEPATHLVDAMEHQRNRLLDLLGALKREEITAPEAREYLDLVGRNLAAVQKAAKALR